MKKLSKRIGIIVLVILVLFITGVKVNHTIRCRKEATVINRYGVGQLVDINGLKLNVDIKTAQNQEIGGKHPDFSKIVYMAGLGVGDIQVSTRPLMDQLINDYDIITIDRPGNGMSEDTKKERTVEAIVEEYRTVLKETKQEAPYILMAHSVAGIYATYWAEAYPEEIEAIIYLDADAAECFVKEGEPGFETLMTAKAEEIVSSMGLQRMLVSQNTLIGDNEKQIYTKEEESIRLKLMYQNTFSKATYGEMRNYTKNAQKVLDQKVPINIPKLYIKADNLHGIYYEDIYKQKLHDRYQGDEDKIQAYIRKKDAQQQEKIGFMKQYGNVTVQIISGPHCIYEYAPDEVASVIHKFMKDNQPVS